MAELHHHIYSVSQLTTEIKLLLEETYSMVWITGEISNFSRPASGHYYFALKDDRAQIQAVIFRGQNRRLAFLPEDGMQITGIGRISIYEPRGTYQVIFEHIEPKGVGAFQIAFEQLKARLSAEGLFDPVHKKQIAFLPQTIAVITSPSGAVIHDIIQIVRRRFSSVSLQVIPVKVQGAEAEEEIVRAISFVNQIPEPPQVIILARGGGSLEDLQAFNSEAVARAIFESQIPIISAIGHETDFTIADFVADLRAPTPSAAAELVVPDRLDLIRRQSALVHRLKSSMTASLSRYQRQLDQLVNRLQNPRKKIQDLRLRIDDHTEHIRRSLDIQRQRYKEHLGFFHHRLLANSPMVRIRQLKVKLEQNVSTIEKHLLNMLEIKQIQLRATTGRLQALNPIAILNRGYSITRSLPGKIVVRNHADVALGQKLEVLVSKGIITCNVEGTYSNDQKDF